MSERFRTTRTEDHVTMGAVSWIIVGLFVDADFFVAVESEPMSALSITR